MADWRFHTTRLRGTTVTGTVPLSAVTFTQRRNAPGEFTATLQLSSDDVQGSVEQMRLIPHGQSVIHCERDGEIVADAVVWTRDYTSRDETYRIGGDSLASWMARRLIDFTHRYDQVDQLDIVRDVLARTQGAPGTAGSIDLLTDTINSGVLRDDTYEQPSGRTVLEHVQALADAARNGFEFDVQTQWLVEQVTVQRRLRLGFPRLGFDSRARGEQPPHVLSYVAPLAQRDLSEAASNCSSYRWPVDGSAYGNRVIGISRRFDGTTDVHIESSTNATTMSAEARLDVASIHDNLGRRDTLIEYTRQALADAERPPVLPEFTVVIDDDEGGNADLAPGNWQVGDDVMCRVIDPLRFPDSDRFPVEFVGRIEQAAVTVDPEEIVVFTVRPLSGQEIPA